MANLVTGFIARVSVSAIVSGAVAAVVVLYARDLSVEALTAESSAVGERLTALEQTSAARRDATDAKLAEIAAMIAALPADAPAGGTASLDTLKSEVVAQSKAQTEAIMALHVETREAIADLRALVAAQPEPGAPADLAPVLDALGRIEARLPPQ